MANLNQFLQYLRETREMLTRLFPPQEEEQVRKDFRNHFERLEAAEKMQKSKSSRHAMSPAE